MNATNVQDLTSEAIVHVAWKVSYTIGSTRNNMLHCGLKNRELFVTIYRHITVKCSHAAAGR